MSGGKQRRWKRERGGEGRGGEGRQEGIGKSIKVVTCQMKTRHGC